jgi:hypothetical protein
MPLDNLPEDFLLEKLPEGIVAEDKRSVMAAVVGGYQERVSDLRAAANEIGNAYTPSAAAPALGNKTAEVIYTGRVGERIKRVLDTDADTPIDEAGLLTWAADQCNIEESAIVSVTLGQDSIRTNQSNTLGLLAATLGCTIAVNPLLSTADAIADQRDQIENYFARLKVKGSEKSIEVAGRVLGFDDVRFASLWQRAVPHVPNDIGAAENEHDFARDPDIEPTATLPDPLGVYNPDDIDDGPFYEWTGSLLGIDNTEQRYITSINGAQPWIRVLEAADPLSRPAPGAYYLEGGGPYDKAAVALTDELVVVATGVGDTYNGLRIDVTDVVDATAGTLTQMRIYDRLSKRKYRSPWFDVGLAMDADAFVTTYGTLPVAHNPDSFTNGATVETILTGKPLTGNTEGVFYSAPAGTGQLRYDLVQQMAAQAADVIDKARPASRYPRRVSAGFSWTDEVAYAPYDYVHQLTDAGSAVTGVATGFPADTANGTEESYDGIISIGGVTYYTGTHASPADRAAHKADFIYVDTSGTFSLNVETLPDDDVLYVTGTAASGTYNTSDRTYYLTKGVDYAYNGSLYALWRTSSTERVRGLPSSETVRWNSYPEDDIDTVAQVAAGSSDNTYLVDETGDVLVDETGDPLSYGSDFDSL